MIDGWKGYYKVVPEITEDIDHYKIVFNFGAGLKEGGLKGGAKGGIKGGVKLSARQKEILDIIKNDPIVSYRTLAEKLNINPSAVQKHINKLKEKGIIRRIGKTRGGYWEVIGSK